MNILFSNKNLKYTIAALAASLFFAGGTVAGKMLANDLPACAFTFLRYGLSSLCLLPFIFFTKERDRLRIQDLPVLLFLGFSGVFLFNVLFFTALSYSSATSISLIGAVVPIATMIGAAIVFRHMPTRLQLVAFGLSFIGVFLVIADGRIGLDIFKCSIGEFLMLAAVVCETMYILAVKKVSNHYSPLFLSFITGVTGVLFVTPFVLNSCSLQVVGNLSLFQWSLLGFISFFGSAFAIILYSAAIKHIGPARTSLLVFSTLPLFVFIIAFITLGECISVWQIIGGHLVISSLIVGEQFS